MTETKPGASSASKAATRAANNTARVAKHPGLVLLVICGAQMMVVLDATIVNIALPSMGAYFDKNQTDMTWALNAYTLAFGGLLLLGGRMGDILGRRRMFIVGLTLFTLGSFVAGIANSFPLLLIGRAVQGLGGAISSPTALSLITTEFREGEERTKAIGIYAAVSGAGAALGLLLGGILTNYLSWRWVLFVNVPIGIVLIGGAVMYLNQSERLKGRFDVLGALLSVAGMVATVYGFIHVARSGWGNTQTYAVFIAAVVLLVAFVLYEAKIVAEPMMPMRIFSDRNRSGAYIVMFVAGAAMFGLFYFITFFVQGVREFSALKTGFSFLPVAFVIGIVSQVVAKMLGKSAGPKPIIVTGTVLLTASMLWFSQVDAGSGYWGVLLPGMIVLAAGMGCLFVPLTSAAVANVANTDAGLASALLNVGQQVGGALGLSVLTTVFGTSSRNFANSHQSDVQQGLRQAVGNDQQLAGAIMKRLQSAGQNGLQQTDITSFINGLPASQRPAAGKFFGGPYRDFSHDLLAHASGQGFLMGAVFGVVAIIVAVVMINVKKSDVPADAAGAAAAA